MSGHDENIGKIVAALATMDPQKVARLVNQLYPATTYLFTPKLADGTRLHLRVDATDYAKIKRKVAWSATIVDRATGDTFHVNGAACSLPGCFCDAIAQRVDGVRVAA